MINTISYRDFAKLDLRTAKIKQVDELENADKLYKLTIELGNKKRTIVAGIKQFYTKEELVGKTIIIIANLEPRRLKSVTSDGMLLAADTNGRPILLTTDGECDSDKKIC